MPVFDIQIVLSSEGVFYLKKERRKRNFDCYTVYVFNIIIFTANQAVQTWLIICVQFLFSVQKHRSTEEVIRLENLERERVVSISAANSEGNELNPKGYSQYNFSVFSHSLLRSVSRRRYDPFLQQVCQFVPHQYCCQSTLLRASSEIPQTPRNVTKLLF